MIGQIHRSYVLCACGTRTHWYRSSGVKLCVHITPTRERCQHGGKRLTDLVTQNVLTRVRDF